MSDAVSEVSKHDKRAKAEKDDKKEKYKGFPPVKFRDYLVVNIKNLVVKLWVENNYTCPYLFITFTNVGHLLGVPSLLEVPVNWQQNAHYTVKKKK